MNTGAIASAERDTLRMARSALADGRAEAAVDLLREPLRRRVLSPHGVERAGHCLVEALATSSLSSTRVLLLGQCTTSRLRNVVVGVGLGANISLTVELGLHDNVLQDLARYPRTDTAEAPVLVLLPWNDRLLGRSERSADERVSDEISFWRAVWSAAKTAGFSRIVQVGLDWTRAGTLGYQLSGRVGEISLVRDANIALRKDLPEGSFFVSMDDISGLVGRDAFYDRRQHLWTGQPFSERGLVELAEHIVAGVRAVTTGPLKVLAIDLDDTLWGGVVGEVGAEGIVFGGTADGEAYVAFQRHLKGLADRGVLLAACTKNNLDDAREPFLTNPEFALTLSDFVAFEATWRPKVESLRRIARELNLGLSSFVYFDDNPAEREHVRQALPEVLVVDVPADPADYVLALEDTLAFETVGLTDEDARRRELYAMDHARRKEWTANTSIEDYLVSLEMVASVRPIEGPDLPRVVQLIGKTNQFNLTARRHGPAQVRRLLDTPRSLGLTLRLRDRFGDHGLVAVVIGVPVDFDEPYQHVLRVDSLLMSCRVIGRTVEHVLIRHLVEEARRLEYRVILGEYVATAKNSQVRGFWESMGFSREVTPQGAVEAGASYTLSLAHAALPWSCIRVDA